MSEPAHIYFEDHKASNDLGRVALRGGLVSVAMKYGSGVLQIVSAIVLARLLAPEDFGLVAIVAVLTGFAPMLIDFGLGDAKTKYYSGPSQYVILGQLCIGPCRCGWCGCLQPTDGVALRRAAARIDHDVVGDFVRTLRHVKSAFGPA